MKRYLFLFILFTISVNDTWAQQPQIDTLIFKYIPPEDTIKYWKTGGLISADLRTVFLTDWTRGGNSNVAFGSALNLFANKAKNRHTLELKLDAAIGVMREGDATYKFKKNNDFIIFNGRYGEKLVNNWFLSGILDMRTQFTKGYRYFRVAGEERRELQSDFLSPLTILPSLGVSLKEKNFAVTVSPISGKFTFYRDDSLAIKARVPGGKNILSEAGPSFVIEDKRPFFKNSEIRYRIQGFSRFTRIVYHWDINAEIWMRFRLHKYVSLIYNHLIIYDDANKLQRSDGRSYTPWQHNQAFNIGFAMDILGNGK
jgi:hypothetical protein